MREDNTRDLYLIEHSCYKKIVRYFSVNNFSRESTYVKNVKYVIPIEITVSQKD